MIHELKSNFETLLTQYPSGMKVNTLLISRCFGVNETYVSVGNGAAELIRSLMRLLDGKIGITLPTFEEYPNRYAENEILTFTPSNKDYSYSADDLMAFYANKPIASLLLINPDNPSGNFIQKKDLLRLLEWCKNRSIRLILDESFVDFSDDAQANSLLHDDILQENPHLIVVKSISKSYGVPGLRLGLLASGNDDLVDQIKKDLPIWNINSFAEFYMQIFNKYEADYKEACKHFIAERNRFYNDLKTIPFLRVIPSQANYFLCEIVSSYTSLELADALLTKYNILIKDCSSKKAFQPHHYVRIAVRSTSDNVALMQALKQL